LVIRNSRSAPSAHSNAEKLLAVAVIQCAINDYRRGKRLVDKHDSVKAFWDNWKILLRKDKIRFGYRVEVMNNYTSAKNFIWPKNKYLPLTELWFHLIDIPLHTIQRKLKEK